MVHRHLSELPEAVSLFISAIGEIVLAYVAIAASNCVNHMCNGNLY